MQAGEEVYMNCEEERMGGRRYREDEVEGVVMRDEEEKNQNRERRKAVN